MFEGLVRQLILGYLGRYVKDIQKEQLKITLWNEEVLLENVELILEAFDYLQLPFALKQGRVGRLSIKIPWKKLGWDPIIIILDDVFISASQRGDQEWSVDAVEKREFAGKKAKLAAAELGKLSRRVSGSQAGQSFISYITAKILDSIQVAIRNFHVLYSDLQNDLGHIMFGLKFSNLTIMKQHLIGPSSGRMRVGQVNKSVEIRGLEFYSSDFHGTMDLVIMDNVANSDSQIDARSEGQSYKSILAPCDVSFILSANRSERLDDSSPYSITAELAGLVICLDEAQLRQMFLVWDYVCTCRLREKYGRYRPWHSPLPKKLKGWQILWWRYAQLSVLSDVHKKLRKSSWKYLGERLIYRRKYINLYKTKLGFLQQEQPVDDDVLRDLELMEKESDVDDILNYRSAAESEMQELFSRCTPDVGMSGVDTPVEKKSIDERSFGKSRGWLNWLSRGMLGAGGTDDSSQFSGVVSDDVIKDIYEATEFQPLISSNSDVAIKDELCLCSIKSKIAHFSATLRSKGHDEGICEIIFEDGIIESKLYKEHATILSKVRSGKMVHPHNKKVILHARRPIVGSDVKDIVDYCCSVQVDFSFNIDIGPSVKAMIQQLEGTFDAQILSNLMEFYDVFTSFKFHNERVLLSLNQIENLNTRVLSKAECVLASHKKVMCDITILDVFITLPWKYTMSEYCDMVIELRCLSFMSSNGHESFSSSVEDQPYTLKSLLNLMSTAGLRSGIQIQDLYHYFEIKLDGFEVYMRNSNQSRRVNIFQKFCASIFLASCVIPDESIFKQLEVFLLIESLDAFFSPSVYASLLELITHIDLYMRDDSDLLHDPYSLDTVSFIPPTSIFGVSFKSKLGSVDLQVDLANNGDNSSVLMLSLQEIDIRYNSAEFEEFFGCMKSLTITASKMKDNKDSCILFLSGDLSPPCKAFQEDCASGSSNSDVTVPADACLAVHYESPDLHFHKCTLYLNNADIHCYPYLVGLLVGFFDRLSAFGTNTKKFSFGNDADISKAIASFGLQKFGFSNYFQPGSSECASIPLDQFPFITIDNSGSLSNLESALIHAIHDWRKHFSLRDRKIRSPKICMRSGSKFCHLPSSKFNSHFGYFLESGMSSITNILSIELHLCGLRAHFHDSSCIVGTIMVPTSKSSLFFNGDCMDILSSSEGLVLTSSWWTRNFHDYLWGPSSANLSPILNVRVRKGQGISSTTEFEVSVGIQHVYCMLPPEYLSIIIGYFSLSDWSGNSTDQLLSDEQSYIDVQNEKRITYKFEILDSTLLLPMENNECQFLKVEMQQLYCSFIHNSCFDDVLRDIPPDLVVPIHKLSKRNHCLNVFVRDLFLSFYLLENDMISLSTIEYDAECVSTTLIAPISADVWVRIPYGSESNCENYSPSTCVMTGIDSCQIIAEDGLFFDGCAALLDIIDQFSSVDDQSKCFKSDVLQFLHSKKSSDEFRTVSQSAHGMMFTEVNCYIESLLVNCYHRNEDSVELITKAGLGFNFSASLINDSLVRLDLRFSSLVLSSVHDSILLAKCHSICSPTVVFSFSKSIDGKNELHVCLPSLDVWLYMSKWIQVVDFLNHFCAHLAKNVHVDASSKSVSINVTDSLEETVVRDPLSLLQSGSTSAEFASEEVEDADFLIIRSNTIVIAFHIPIWVSEEPVQCQLAEYLMVTPSSVSSVKYTDSKLLTISFNIKSFELYVSNRSIQLKSKMEKLTGKIIIVENRRRTSWPLFEIVPVYIEALLCNYQKDGVEVKMEVTCDHADMWLSHPVFYFWSAVKYDVSMAQSSELSSSVIDFKLQLRKVSVLLTDGRWSCSGPQLEILLRNIVLHANVIGKHMECSVVGDLHANYNNIEKVSWEPFIEPWQFLLTLIREQDMSLLLDNSVITDIIIKSTTQLNLNITESFVECVSRIIEMVLDAWGLVGSKDNFEGNKMLHSPSAEHICARKYAAPYILQNLTSVPLLFNVYHGPMNPDEFDKSEVKDGKQVQPGSAVAIYTEENAEEQLSHYRPARSSDSLCDQRSNGFAYHYITIQLDGTSAPSAPMSMDFVGLTYFEVNFSKAYNENFEEGRFDATTSFVVPVVLDVSAQRYSKLIRIYSTVVLSNATSTPLELRFDIPLGVSPKILDPIYPGQQLPLPLHLAEAGSVRWRPIGHSYLWSEAHNLPKLFLLDNKLNFKSFVCYPAHPSSDPFRCCLSVRNISLTSSGCLRKNVLGDEAKKRFAHHVILSAPLVVNSYLPKEILLNIDSGGVNHAIIVSKVETSVYHIDPSHDLGLQICIDGFKPSDFKFPRLETFCTMAKLNGRKFTLSETLTFESNDSSDPLYVTVEKVMDAYSSSRELVIFVPFLLYNCTGFPLLITEAKSETKGRGCVIPSYHGVGQNDTLFGKKDGLSLLSSGYNLDAAVLGNLGSSLKNHIISSREIINPHSQSYKSNSLHVNSERQTSKSISDFQNYSLRSLNDGMNSSFQSIFEGSGSDNHEQEKVWPCMYSPNPSFSVSDVLVKVSRCIPEYAVQNLPQILWSSPFFLLPPSGSSTILVPQLSSNAAFVIALTSSSITGPYYGRTTAITFQPRYIISNACSRDICYKQKGRDVVFQLGVGEHASLHWTDTTRELLVSICYNEPGWQWSGSFLPDHLGDTQVKMRNFVSGNLNMIRVEVQNADISMVDEKIVGNIKGNSGTNLILLSDDNTGYMPYRIDNFSKERLRIYQQRCEMFETIVHSYTSCHYSWDEPCYPHRLIVEVPGERVLGSYALDDVKEYMPVYLPSTSEKPERTFLLSVLAEGATKVLRVVDSNYHILNDMTASSVGHSAEKKYPHKQVKPLEYREKISIVIPYIGISLINSHPQELIFACMKGIQIDLLQSLDRQSLSLQILFLQIDNQLRTTSYPVMLSFDSEYRSYQVDNVIIKDDVSRTQIEKRNQMNFCDSSCDPVFCLAVSKWRKKDISFISFEYIRLRMADFRLELEQEVILSLFEFFTNVSSRFQYGIVPFSDSLLFPCKSHGDSVKDSSVVQTSENFILRGNQYHPLIDPVFNGKTKSIVSLPSIVPIGAPWQQIYLLARTQKKIYIEVLELAPFKLTLSFSSAPWMLQNRILTSKESLIHRGLMALADVEGARIHLKELTIAHHMASWESIEEILIRHYARQLLHEIYKLFGSAGVIGNPLGFARSMGLGIRDFLSVPAKSIMQSPTGLITGVAQGTTSLLSNTVYAVSDAASQFSKAARKGIVAFTYDDQAVSRMEKQQTSGTSDSKGVINEVLEGLTGLLQSPIRGAERHGLPGVLSGIALGVTGLVAKPAASILEVTGKTALGIRNRSKPNQTRSQRFRVRLPRPLASDLPLRPYSWEEAVGTSLLIEADDGLKYKDETLVACKALKEGGRFVILTNRLLLIVSCPYLIKLGKPEFSGIPADLHWTIELEIGLESIIHADIGQGVVHIVGSRPDTLLRQNQHSPKRGSGGRTRAPHWNHFPTHLPLSQTSLELASEEDAQNFLQIFLSAIETGKEQGWGCRHFLHRANIK
ncbi:hypothetical protein L6164_016738 [Bauhinia variegata]|uniref:Uncharacterized protein n=1 Tax=Bauhinia variegata TaxID=167791 RepID=A0ACB9N5B2_BAUVA|nr:hypothetical protein L6164_016738 [Bauhinia variegata]